MSDQEASQSKQGARDLPRVPPPGWDWDLWQQFRYGAIYGEEVPRDLDGEPLLDVDGRPAKQGEERWASCAECGDTGLMSTLAPCTTFDRECGCNGPRVEVPCEFCGVGEGRA